MKVAIIGAGWAGMSAAVKAVESGYTTTVFEASRLLGGRARALQATLPNGAPVTLDNGQHILIGAYSETLRLMKQVGVKVDDMLLRRPLALKFSDGTGLALPDWPSPLNAIAGIATARGWSVSDKASLVRVALGWRLHGFVCAEHTTVAQLCQSLAIRVMQELIEPLCVSALNTPADRASGRVFLRVMRDSLFSGAGGSDLLLPTTDLTALFPQAASNWIAQRGARVLTGVRINQLAQIDNSTRWRLSGPQFGQEEFDRVIIATPASSALSLLENCAAAAPWVAAARALRFEAITTVYAWGKGAVLPWPMLALRSTSQPTATAAPAQFVFDRGQLGGPAGLLAFVISASDGERDSLQAQTLAQARAQLGLRLEAVQTVVERRATFACTPMLVRPNSHVAPGLLACADYVDGPYPATLEGAVRSGLAATLAL